MMRRSLAVAALLLLAPPALSAQNAPAQPANRAALVTQAAAAYENVEPDRALQLARAALDPALGGADTTWVRALHLLAQVLVENGNEPDARTWARWGMRLNPTMRIDTVNYLAGVVSVLRDARAYASVRTDSDDLTRMTWTWPGRTSTATQGTLRLDPSPMSAAIRVTVSNAATTPGGARGTPVGQLVAGAGLALPPGSYEIEVTATGFLPARITREVLPGATLTLAFQLTSSAVISATITDAARQNAYRSTAALSVSRFGTPAPACAAGVVAGSRLLLTSYTAIRGADALTVRINGQPVTGELRVAAYDAGANLAVVVLPAARTDSVALATQIIDGQSAWAITLAQCATIADTRANIDEWAQRPLGALRLSTTIAQGVNGAPVVDYLGRLAGVWTAGAGAIPAPNASAQLAQARQAITAQQTVTLAEVARRESHLYGGVTVATDVPGATVKLTGLERWHWTEVTAGATGPAPYNFSGPMGRYRLETSAPGLQTRTQEIVIRPGETIRVAVPLRTAVAQGPQGPAQPQAAPKKSKKWVWIAVIGGAAGAAAALGGGGGTPAATTGSINISVPNP